jgi:aryl-alcohol dehydrogenase-like predicted oxidoreductase
MRSERRLGEAIKPTAPAIISTKVGRLLEPRQAGDAAEGGIYVDTPR